VEELIPSISNEFLKKVYRFGGLFLSKKEQKSKYAANE